MVLVGQRTKIKNRIHANLAKYGAPSRGASDMFGVRGRALLRKRADELPPETRMAELFQPTPELELIETLPGVGFVLGVVIVTEVGDVGRFPSSSHLASYTGMTPRVHASGGRVRYGSTRSDVNRYLKWAYTEAANTVMIHRRKHPEHHVSRLHERVRRRSGHQKAIGAVGLPPRTVRIEC